MIIDTIWFEFVIPVPENVNGFYRYARIRGLIVICENATSVWLRRGAHVLEIYLLTQDSSLLCDLMRRHSAAFVTSIMDGRKYCHCDYGKKSAGRGGDVVQRDGRCISFVAYHSFLAMIVMGCCCSRPDHCSLGVSKQLTERYT